MALPSKISTARQPIQALPTEVINRIAAGEVVQRPMNVVKELMENSLDAGSHCIQISLRQGGLKYIQIVDDGCGIVKADFPLVCQRYATSKLREFTDLQSIATFGFRGEALASVSYVSRVTITSRTPDNVCAYRAEYGDGLMKNPNPRPCAGNVGTSFIVEDLFYNCPQRVRTLGSTRDEFQRICDVVRRYAILNHSVSFSVMRLDESINGAGSGTGGVGACDFKTPLGQTDVKQRLIFLYGTQLTNDLLPVEHKDDILHYEMDGYLTHPNYQYNSRVSASSTSSSSRSSIGGSSIEFILFLNRRLVECAPLKKALDSVYTNLLPKRTQAFIYISLTLPANRVDVNVHPTKHEVFFLHMEAIIASIQSVVEKILLSTNTSRSYALLHPPNKSLSLYNDVAEPLSQEEDVNIATLPDNHRVSLNANLEVNNSEIDLEVKLAQRHDVTLNVIRDAVKEKQTEYFQMQSTMIRTDRRQQKLLSFFSSNSRQSSCEENEVEKISATNSVGRKTESPAPPEPPLPRLSTLWEHPLCNLPDTAMKQLNNEDDLQRNSVDTSVKVSSRSSASPGEEYENGGIFLQQKSHSRLNAERKKDKTSPSRISKSAVNTSPSDCKRMRPEGYREFHLTSLLSLRQTVEDNQCAHLRRVFHHLTFVGCLNQEWLLAQSEEDLLLLNLRKCTRHFFYQLALQQFGNIGHIMLNPPLGIHDMLDMALQCSFNDMQETTIKTHKNEMLTSAKRILLERADMMADYFGLTIDTVGECLVTLPYLLGRYMPDLDALPIFLLRLAVNVRWTDEKECFHTFCDELSIFYSAKFPMFPRTNHNTLSNKETSSISTTSTTYDDVDWKWRMEHVLVPALKCGFLPPKTLWNESAIVKVASLNQLYKVFERC